MQQTFEPLLPEAELLAKIAQGAPVSATHEDGAFTVKFDPEIPYLCFAIHDGHRMRDDVQAKCSLEADERRYEEDPLTGALIAGLPNQIIAHDSRYEYDLNRNARDAIYDEAWGVKVWSEPLTEEQRAASLAKHARFYRVVDAIANELKKRHGTFAVYDIHSYNGRRQGGDEAPLYNIGTSQIDLRRHQRSISYLLRNLADVTVPNEVCTAETDTIFQGRGYLATVIRRDFPTAFCVPLDIRKVFCDERSGEPFPQVFDILKLGLSDVISRHAAFFVRTNLSRSRVRGSDMLASELDPTALSVDKELFKLSRKLETLYYVNPVNLDQECAKFFKSKNRIEPNFRYRHLDLDPYAFRERLYRLPVEQIADTQLQHLYRRAIDGLAAKVDLISSVGTPEFLYNSLRYYGEPNTTDIANARFLIHAPAVPDEVISSDDLLNAEQVQRALQQEVDRYGMDAPVKISNRLLSGAMVDNSKFLLLVRKGFQTDRTSLLGLMHHEVGVHLVTAANARDQRLQIFRLGLPGSTESQEGVAVLAEFLAGAMSVTRLKTLATRVLAVRHMLDGHSFTRCHEALMDECNVSKEQAFTTIARVFRGGGFTKDFLYLRGLAQAFDHYQQGRDWDALMIGKTAFRDWGLINGLMERGVVKKPSLRCRILGAPQTVNPIHTYLLTGLVFAPNGIVGGTGWTRQSSY